MEIRPCTFCAEPMEMRRSTKKFCSTVCSQRHARGWPRERACRHCGSAFLVKERADANRQHCSKECAKNHNAKRVGEWHAQHPDEMRQYTRRWREKNPDYYKTIHGGKRGEILRLLGGKCVVCAADNPSWLHVDYIPTCRELRFRHPRHLTFVRENLDDFRILCANHHYELTLTGRIEGTEITQ